jgi:hypothetical protein
MPASTGTLVGLIALLSTTPSCVAFGQRIADARVTPGVPVRVVNWPGQGETGTYVAQSDSGLTIRRTCSAACDSIATFSWNELASVDARVRQDQSPGRTIAGGMIGAVSGLAAAFIAATATNAVAPCQFDNGSCPILGFLVLGPAIIITGTVVGARVGWRHESDEWVTMWPTER